MVLTTAKILVSTKSIDIIKSLLKTALAQDIIDSNNESFLALDVSHPYTEDVALIWLVVVDVLFSYDRWKHILDLGPV